MSHKERKARWHAITQVRERTRPALDDQLKQVLKPESQDPLAPMPWEERPDTDD